LVAGATKLPFGIIVIARDGVVHSVCMFCRVPQRHFEAMPESDGPSVCVLWAASVHDFPLVGVTRDAVLGTGRPAWSVFDLAARVSGGGALSSEGVAHGVGLAGWAPVAGFLAGSGRAAVASRSWPVLGVVATLIG
jgi:hypothetical protein